MVISIYDFEVSGLSGSGNTWKVKGTMADSFRPINFPKLVDAIVGEVFMKLTKGKAVFEHPGKGCDGPYKYTKIVIEWKEDLED